MCAEIAPLKNKKNICAKVNKDLTGPQIYGLTKREYFALHAPKIPDWYKILWEQEHCHLKEFFDSHFDEFAEHCPTAYSYIRPAGAKKLMKDWAYHYADLMLDEEEGEDEKAS